MASVPFSSFVEVPDDLVSQAIVGVIRAASGPSFSVSLHPFLCADGKVFRAFVEVKGASGSFIPRQGKQGSGSTPEEALVDLAKECGIYEHVQAAIMKTQTPQAMVHVVRRRL